MSSGESLSSLIFFVVLDAEVPEDEEGANAHECVRRVLEVITGLT